MKIRLFRTEAIIMALLVSSFVISQSQSGGTDAQKISALFPGLKISSIATGDLDGDGIADVAVILVNAKEESEAAKLVVYSADRSGKLKQVASSDKAVCFGCGGMKGGKEPFDLKIKNNLLLLHFNGGSREEIESTTKWRYQDQDVYLVGSTVTLTDTLANEKGKVRTVVRDANMSTLKMTEKLSSVVQKSKDDADPKLKSTIKDCNVDPKFKKLKLSAFSNDDELPFCTKLDEF